MNGILYFSATGNSLFIAQKIKEKIGGQILYIPKYAGDGSEFEKIIVVSPIYSGGLPVHTYDLLPRLSKDVELTVVLDYGGAPMGADRLTLAYAQSLHLNLLAIYTVKMPENYTLFFNPLKLFNDISVKKSFARAEKVADGILHGEKHLPKKTKSKNDAYEKNKGNWHIIGERFSVTDACVKCGKCVSVCPVNNISFADGKVTFSHQCVACLGCYHRCPQKAIVYNGRRKKFRYVNPNVKESDIGASEDL